MKIFYYIRRFWEIPWLEKRLFIKGFILSIFLPPTTQVFSFKYYRKILLPSINDFHEVTEFEKIQIKVLKKTLKRIENFSPVILTCLHKGIIFKILSDSLKLNYSISFVAIKSENSKLMAHSFISRNDKVIYLSNKRFNETTPLLTV
jgi:hypothetical protein